ncbi:MAG: hypothetical protein ABT01_08840 [Clostridium sp. SCN 57-10]|nr:MAG: hypothetical protein ABT01_08840 [Clostridium sp. SCN 57-10]
MAVGKKGGAVLLRVGRSHAKDGGESARKIGRAVAVVPRARNHKRSALFRPGDRIPKRGGIGIGSGADVNDATAVHIDRIADYLRQHSQIAFDGLILLGFTVIDQGNQGCVGAKAADASRLAAHNDSCNGRAVARDVLRRGVRQDIVAPLIQIAPMDSGRGDTGVNHRDANTTVHQPMGGDGKER